MGHDAGVQIAAEFTIEPFVEGSPGPHVRVAIDVAESAGLTVEVGPFGTALSGESGTVLDTVDAVVRRLTGGLRAGSEEAASGLMWHAADRAAPGNLGPLGSGPVRPEGEPK